MRRPLRALGLLLLAALVALLALDLRHPLAHAPPRLTAQTAAQGPLEAAWASADLRVPYPSVPAGYGPRDRPSVAAAATPSQARALAFRSGPARFTLVSVDLLEIDAALRGEVALALGADAGALWLCATHSHSAMGEYDPSVVAQVAATGRFRAEARRALVEAIVAAVRDAQSRLAPARLAATREPTPPWVINRDDRAVGVDATQGVLQLETAQGRAVLRVLGAHPALVGRPALQLDGDYPARWVAQEAAQGRFGLLLQGAGGDASVDRGALATPELVAAALAPLPDAGLDPVSDLSESEVEVELPDPEIGVAPTGLGRAAANGFDWLGPHTATVAAARLGSVNLLALPGELTASARAALPADAWPVTLCNGYVGYIEAPALVKAGRGETRHSYYGADLLPAIAQGAEAARSACLAPQRP